MNNCDAKLVQFTSAVKQLCKDFSDLRDRPYMGDVTSAIDSLLVEFMKTDGCSACSEVEPYADALRSLASYVGAGGYNSLTVDPVVFEKKIRWGINQITDVSRTDGQFVKPSVLRQVDVRYSDSSE